MTAVFTKCFGTWRGRNSVLWKS